MKKNIAQGIISPQDFINEGHLTALKDKGGKKGDGIFVLTSNELKSLELSKEESKIIKPYYTTEQLYRYYGDKKNEFWIIYSDITVRENINKYSNIKKHLNKFKDIITSDFGPYGLHRARDQQFFEGKKILVQRKSKTPIFTYTDFSCYVSQTFYIIQPKDINLKYLIGLLNSNVVNFWLYNKGKKQGDQLQIDAEPLLKIPLIKTNNVKLQDKLIALVDIMTGLTAKMEVSRGEEKERLQRQIAETDQEIDALVYKLYGLTPAEIKIIEGFADKNNS